MSLTPYTDWENAVDRENVLLSTIYERGQAAGLEPSAIGWYQDIARNALRRGGLDSARLLAGREPVDLCILELYLTHPAPPAPAPVPARLDRVAHRLRRLLRTGS